jgi:soluble lytic murein transglycosylase-like protein
MKIKVVITFILLFTFMVSPCSNQECNKKDIKKLDKMEAIKAHIHTFSSKYDVDPRLVKSIIHVESDFNPHAVSRCGAIGLMQLMPSTARNLGVTNPYSMKQNIEGGTKYISILLKEHKDIRLAVAAYNAGGGSVKRYGGIPPYRETILFVKRVMELYYEG